MTFAGPFELSIAHEPLELLDKVARAAAHPSNYGDRSRWELNWASACAGIHARYYSIGHHYNEMHAWIPRVRYIVEVEAHVSAVLFGMASAFECYAFGLNAVGFGIEPKDFLDVTDRGALARISAGIVCSSKKSERQVGFSRFFPSLQNHWISETTFIRQVSNLHSVSKHRSAVLGGGSYRQDPPEGYLEGLGLTKMECDLRQMTPWAEVLLDSDPKAPWLGRTSRPREDSVRLENLAVHFKTFIEKTAVLAADDLRRVLPSYRLRSAPASARTRGKSPKA